MQPVDLVRTYTESEVGEIVGFAFSFGGIVGAALALLVYRAIEAFWGERNKE